MEIGTINLDYLGHSGFLITTKEGLKIAIDPYNLSPTLSKADIILITHSHYDHCSIKDIQKLAKKGATIIVPADAQSKIAHIQDVKMQVIEIGDEIQLEGLKIQAVPAYNKDKTFHEKKEGWFGYILKINDLIIYHAGDTDQISEMCKLSGYGKQGNTFITLLPVSGTYVMTAEEAAHAAKLLNPTIAIPMHFGAGVAGTLEDAQHFCELCEKQGIKAQILEKI